jgi:bacterioferritin
MKGNDRVIEALNELLTLELTIVNQYFLHSRMCENWGYRGLGARLRQTAMEEMKDAEELIDRILLLEGVPNMQRLGPVTIGETVPEQLEIQIEGEKRALTLLADGVTLAEKEGDAASREFLARRLEEEERHLDWLETQLALIRRVGEENYLAQQIRGD